jgi:hypothetical protein
VGRAEGPDAANELARSRQRVARSYRQTLALKARLAREIATAEREARLNLRRSARAPRAGAWARSARRSPAPAYAASDRAKCR